MRKPLIAGLLALGIAGCAVFAEPAPNQPTVPLPVFTSYALPAVTPQAPLAGAVVKILANGGHGSGTHLGSRYILSAAHVTEGSKTVQIKADDGSLRTADVLWSNVEYDIVLLRMQESGTGRIPLESAALACREPGVGEALRLAGNPGNIEFISTYGRVAGKARKVSQIKSAIVLDATVAPGMSGGGAFDEAGNVVGVTVALMAVPMGMGASLIPVSYIVPASAVCTLMGRDTV